MTTVRFATPADLPRLWELLWGLATYERWTAEFCEGSRFEGSWEQGSRIRFLSPSGDGVVAEIAESRKDAFISIRHLGFIANGIEDTTSEAVRAWAPAYENYTLQVVPEGTRMVVDQDVAAEWEDHMNQAWPQALGLLKDLCESSSAA